jgi:hypothetical protein
MIRRSENKPINLPYAAADSVSRQGGVAGERAFHTAETNLQVKYQAAEFPQTQWGPMSNRTLVVAAAICSFAAPALAPAALAQPGGASGLPTPEVIAKAGAFKPPRLSAYAQKLASQPDMTGSWKPLDPKDAGHGPVFDPEHAVWPPNQPQPGEATFGPVAGTYIKGIPYRPEYQRRYEALIKETTEGKSRDTFAACAPFGVPRMLGATPTSFDIVQAPEIIDWNNNYGRSQRRIFLDGRPHPAPGTMDPTWSGHSIGRWEGDTLVVDTVNLIGGYLDETPAPYSDQLHLVERIRLIDTNILEDRMTFTDPVMLEKPWVVTRYYRRGVGSGPGSGLSREDAPPPPADKGPYVQGGDKIVRDFFELNDRPCVPNVRMDENGFQVMLLPAEIEAAAAKAKAGSPVK